MKRQKRLVWLCLALSPLVFGSCSDDDDDDLIGYWVRMSDFDGLARGEASGFTIGNKGYLACGFDGSKNNERMSDLWEYDMEMDAWMQKADFPGSARSKATAFSIGDKGYLGTGYNYTTEGGEVYLNDFWEYDPASNTWTQKADFPGSARYDAVSFSVLGKGYIGAGYDGNYLKDFYAYEPSSNSWQQIVSIGGTKRQGASSFVIDDVAYICCGQNNGEYVYDFWKYDPASGSWTQLRDIANNSDDDYDDDYNIARRETVSFVIDGKGYIATGYSGGVTSDYWVYDPATDLWSGDSDDDFTPLTEATYGGSSRSAACSFSTGTRGFVLLGQTGGSYLEDVYELLPYEQEDAD